MHSGSEERIQSDSPATAVITQSAFTLMTAHCKATLPLEACGVLTSTNTTLTVDGTTMPIIDGVLPIRNASPYPERTFSFHPSDWIQAYYDTRKNRQSIVGFFHSHPYAAPIPSPSDEAGWLERTGHGPYSYWIVSLWDDEQPTCRAYRRSALADADGSSMFAQVRIQIA